MTKYCVRCGHPAEAEMLFCENCGAKLEPYPAAAEPAAEAAENADALPVQNAELTGADTAYKAPQPPKPVFTKKTAAILGGVLAAIVVLVLGALIAVSAARTVKLDKYITVTSVGADGYGSLKVSFDDDDEFYYKLRDYAGNKADGSFYSSFSLLDKIDDVEERIEYELPETNGSLKNGDTVEIRVTYTGPEKNSYFNCRFKGGAVTYKVEGLIEAQAYDALSETLVQVNFNNDYPNGWGEAKVETLMGYWSSPICWTVKYTLDRTSELRNGDVVTLTADFGERFETTAAEMAQKGYIITQNQTKQFTVSGLKEYASAENITPETVETVKALALADMAGIEGAQNAQILGVLYKDAIEKDYTRDYSDFLAFSPNCYNRIVVAVKYETVQAAEAAVDAEGNAAAPAVTVHTGMYCYSDLVVNEDGSVSPEAGWELGQPKKNYSCFSEGDFTMEEYIKKEVDTSPSTWSVTNF